MYLDSLACALKTDENCYFIFENDGTQWCASWISKSLMLRLLREGLELKSFLGEVLSKNLKIPIQPPLLSHHVFEL